MARKAAVKAEPKKNKKAEEQQALNEVELAILEDANTEKEYAVRYKDKTMKMTVRSTIPTETIHMLVANTENVYFMDGDYDPFVGDLVMKLMLTQAYTDLTFNDDIDVFKLFWENAVVVDGKDESEMRQTMPKEFWTIFMVCQNKAENLCRKHMPPTEEAEMFTAVKDLVGRARNTLDTLETYLNSAADQLKADDGVHVKEIVEAMQMLGRKDEKKIAEAVLDFQREKATRERVAKREDK